MKVLNLVFALALFQFLAIDSANAQKKKKNDPAAYMVEEEYEAPVGRLFDEASFLAGTSILNKFTNVIVVNKAAKGKTAQTMRMFTDGKEIQLDSNKVSTGREVVEMVRGVTKAVRWLGLSKGTTESHWRHTTRGFYIVSRVEDKDYTSGESKFHMPYAIFFNRDKGLALHEVPWEITDAGHAALGHRASSGCVRVHKNTIPGINQAVRDAGKGTVPDISRKTGLQEVDSKGNPKFLKDAWKTIVIIEEVND